MIEATTFEGLRSYLFAIAYRMLGTAGEAEDVIQDAWLRAASSPETPASAKAWLATVVTRLCLDRLKSARAAREQYTGPWLPEPVPTDRNPESEQSVMRRESITMAFLVLLETLSPSERAAFLLREVFDYEYAEVAEVLESSEAATRQLVHRARKHLSAMRPRFDTVMIFSIADARIARIFSIRNPGKLRWIEGRLQAGQDCEFPSRSPKN